MAVEPGRELLILGMLRRSPLSAYALTRAVKMHSSLYKSLSRGNIYEQLALLHDRGFVTAQAERAARGPRTTKTVYSLAASGRRRFDALLLSIFSDAQASDATLEVACVLLGQLPRARAAALLKHRLDVLERHSARLVRLFGKPEERSGAALLAMTHAIERVAGEVKWTKNALRNLANPRWRPEWISDDDATARSRRLP